VPLSQSCKIIVEKCPKHQVAGYPMAQGAKQDYMNDISPLLMRS